MCPVSGSHHTEQETEAGLSRAARATAWVPAWARLVVTALGWQGQQGVGELPRQPEPPTHEKASIEWVPARGTTAGPQHCRPENVREQNWHSSRLSQSRPAGFLKWGICEPGRQAGSSATDSSASTEPRQVPRRRAASESAAARARPAEATGREGQGGPPPGSLQSPRSLCRPPTPGTGSSLPRVLRVRGPSRRSCSVPQPSVSPTYLCQAPTPPTLHQARFGHGTPHMQGPLQSVSRCRASLLRLAFDRVQRHRPPDTSLGRCGRGGFNSPTKVHALLPRHSDKRDPASKRRICTTRGQPRRQSQPELSMGKPAPRWAPAPAKQTTQCPPPHVSYLPALTV